MFVDILCRYVDMCRRAQVCSPGPAQTEHTAQFRPAPAPASITPDTRVLPQPSCCHSCHTITCQHRYLATKRQHSTKERQSPPPRKWQCRFRIYNLIFEQIYLILQLQLLISSSNVQDHNNVMWMFPPLIVSGSSVFNADYDFTLSFFHKMISLLYK